LHFALHFNLILLDKVNYDVCNCSHNARESVLYIVEAVIMSYMKHIYHKEMPCCYWDKKKWWKGKPSGSIACTRKQQPRFYRSCSSAVMNDATPLTPLAHERNSIFKCKQHTCTLHDPWGPEKYDYTMM